MIRKGINKGMVLLLKEIIQIIILGELKLSLGKLCKKLHLKINIRIKCHLIL
jgi:hypothetical protein